MNQNRQDVPRVDLDFPATVFLADDSVVYLSGLNISRGGMGLGCDSSTAQALVLRGSVVSPDAGAEFNLHWELPALPPVLPDRSIGLGARARLAWSQPAGTEGHRLGLRFVTFEPDSEAKLSAFVEEAIRP